MTGVENDMFWSEIGSGFGEPGGTPPPMILRSTPNPLLPPVFFLFRFAVCVIDILVVAGLP